MATPNGRAEITGNLRVHRPSKLMTMVKILAVVLLYASSASGFTASTGCSAVATRPPPAAAISAVMPSPTMRRPAVRELPVVAVTPVEVALGFAAVTGLVVVGGTATVLAGSAEFQLPMERRRQEEAARLAELQNDAALQNELRLE